MAHSSNEMKEADSLVHPVVPPPLHRSPSSAATTYVSTSTALCPTGSPRRTETLAHGRVSG